MPLLWSLGFFVHIYYKYGAPLELLMGVHSLALSINRVLPKNTANANWVPGPA